MFFSDIAGFTSISEELTAMATVNLLNHYFAAVTESIRTNNGIVDKFIGDAVMAFWCSPFSPGDSHAAAACRSALAQQVAIGRLNPDLPNILGLRRTAPTLAVRMGIATGEVVLGTIGSTVSKSFTVIGDTVNLASRLEGVNKVFGTRIIVAESTLKLARSEVEARELDLITVVGKTEPVRIYELICLAGQLGPAESELLQGVRERAGSLPGAGLGRRRAAIPPLPGAQHQGRPLCPLPRPYCSVAGEPAAWRLGRRLAAQAQVTIGDSTAKFCRTPYMISDVMAPRLGCERLSAGAARTVFVQRALDEWNGMFRMNGINPSSTFQGSVSLKNKDLRCRSTLHGGVRPPGSGVNNGPGSASPGFSRMACCSADGTAARSNAKRLPSLVR